MHILSIFNEISYIQEHFPGVHWEDNKNFSQDCIDGNIYPNYYSSPLKNLKTKLSPADYQALKTVLDSMHSDLCSLVAVGLTLNGKIEGWKRIAKNTAQHGLQKALEIEGVNNNHKAHQCQRRTL